MSRPCLALISDFNVKEIFLNGKEIRIGTPFGPSEIMYKMEFDQWEIIYLQRREVEDEIPIRFNYRANIWGINKLGVERIVSLNNFRALNKKYLVGDIILPNNLIDFTKESIQTYYDKLLIDSIDLSKPFCTQMREILIKSSNSFSKRVWEEGIVACLVVPRFETLAERKMFTMLGCDLINVGISPEIFLSRELRMCYASIGVVYDKAKDLKYAKEEKLINFERASMNLKKILKDCIGDLLNIRGCSCKLSE